MQPIASPSEPRKSPDQARSTASVDAILKASVQVLLRVGKEKLTTTRVAARAGVSVGTLYQYFPNKTALLRAAMRLHMEEILAEILSRLSRLFFLFRGVQRGYFSFQRERSETMKADKLLISAIRLHCRSRLCLKMAH